MLEISQVLLRRGGGINFWSTVDGICYLGETKQRLKDRFNEHRRTLDNANIKSKTTTVAEHFLSSSHDISKDMQLIPIEKMFSNRDSIRKAREAFLISKGRTIDPNGLISAKKRIRFPVSVKRRLQTADQG